MLNGNLKGCREMKKFEYKIIAKSIPAAMNIKKYDETAEQIEKELNQLGADGWEFIQWKNSMMILKRDAL